MQGQNSAALVLLVVALACGPGGCSRPNNETAANRAGTPPPATNPTTAPAAGTATPEALVARVVAALRCGDRDALAACFDRSNETSATGADLFLSGFDRDVAVNEFGQAVREKFGESTLRNLPPGYRDNAGAGLADRLASASVDNRGDVATVTTSGGILQSRLVMRRRDGKWWVDGSSAVPPAPGGIDAARKTLEESRAGVAELRRARRLLHDSSDWADFERRAAEEQQQPSTLPADLLNRRQPDLP